MYLFCSVLFCITLAASVSLRLEPTTRRPTLRLARLFSTAEAASHPSRICLAGKRLPASVKTDGDVLRCQIVLIRLYAPVLPLGILPARCVFLADLNSTRFYQCSFGFEPLDIEQQAGKGGGATSMIRFSIRKTLANKTLHRVTTYT